MHAGFVRSAAVAVGVAAAYFVTGRLGLLLAIPPGYATAVWPPSGIALAAALLAGRPAVVGTFLGSYLVNLGNGFDLADPALTLGLPALVAFGAALQAAAGAWLVRRAVPDPADLTREADVLRLLVLGGPVGCLVNATWSVPLLVAAGRVDPSAAWFSWWTWWLGDAVAVPVFAPMVLVACRTAGPLWWRRQAFVSLPLAVTFALVVALYFVAGARERERLDGEFRRQAAEAGRRLEDRLEAAVAPLAALRAAHDAYGRIDEQQFRTVVRALAPGRAAAAVSWNRVVPARDRPAAERELRAAGAAGVTELSPDGRLVPAGERPSYVVVRHIEPPADAQPALGYDVASEPTRRAALDAARDAGTPAASGRVGLVQRHRGEPGVLVFLPVYAGGGVPADAAGRRAKLVAYATAVIDAAGFVADSLAGFDRAGLRLELTDGAADADARRLYADPVAADPAGVVWTGLLTVGGRPWMLTVAPTPAYAAAHRSLQAWSVLAGGMLFTGLLGALLLTATGRGEAVERRVAEQTAELRASRQFVEAITAAVPGVVYLYDLPGRRLVYANRGPDALAGYPFGGPGGAVHDDDRPAVAAHLGRVAAAPDGEVLAVEYRTARPDGAAAWAAASESVFRRGPDGDVRLVVGVSQDVTARMAAERGLRDLLHQREVLLKEVHHRVKNNLQVVTSLLFLQGRYAAGDPRLAGILRDSQDRVRAMALVHENLYRTGDLARVHMPEYLDALVQQLARSHGLAAGRVNIVCDAAPLALDMDHAVPCGLILTELVTNCLKHAFPGGRAGTVRVGLGPAGGGALELVVADDGVGLPKCCGGEGAKSLGVQLVRRLARQLGGEAAFGYAGGTRVAVRFPAPPAADGGTS